MPAPARPKGYYYRCTNSACPPTLLFRTLAEWSTHEEKKHKKTWTCFGHIPPSTSSGRHNSNGTGSICGKFFLKYPEYRRHVIQEGHFFDGDDIDMLVWPVNGIGAPISGNTCEARKVKMDLMNKEKSGGAEAYAVMEESESAIVGIAADARTNRRKRRREALDEPTTNFSAADEEVLQDGADDRPRPKKKFRRSSAVEKKRTVQASVGIDTSMEATVQDTGLETVKSPKRNSDGDDRRELGARAASTPVISQDDTATETSTIKKHFARRSNILPAVTLMQKTIKRKVAVPQQDSEDSIEEHPMPRKKTRVKRERPSPKLQVSLMPASTLTASALTNTATPQIVSTPKLRQAIPPLKPTENVQLKTKSLEEASGSVYTQINSQRYKSEEGAARPTALVRGLGITYSSPVLTTQPHGPSLFSSAHTRLHLTYAPGSQPVRGFVSGSTAFGSMTSSNERQTAGQIHQIHAPQKPDARLVSAPQGGHLERSLQQQGFAENAMARCLTIPERVREGNVVPSTGQTRLFLPTNPHDTFFAPIQYDPPTLRANHQNQFFPRMTNSRGISRPHGGNSEMAPLPQPNSSTFLTTQTATTTSSQANQKTTIVIDEETDGELSEAGSDIGLSEEEHVDFRPPTPRIKSSVASTSPVTPVAPTANMARPSNSNNSAQPATQPVAFAVAAHGDVPLYPVVGANTLGTTSSRARAGQGILAGFTMPNPRRIDDIVPGSVEDRLFLEGLLLNFDQAEAQLALAKIQVRQNNFLREMASLEQSGQIAPGFGAALMHRLAQHAVPQQQIGLQGHQVQQVQQGHQAPQGQQQGQQQ